MNTDEHHIEVGPAQTSDVSNDVPVFEHQGVKPSEVYSSSKKMSEISAAP